MAGNWECTGIWNSSETDFISAILWKSVFWYPLLIFFCTEKNVCVLKAALWLVCLCGLSWTGLVKCSCCPYHWTAMPITKQLNHSQRHFWGICLLKFKSWVWAWKVSYFIYYLLWIIMSLSLRTDRIEALFISLLQLLWSRNWQVGSWMFLNNIHTQLYGMCSCWKKGYFFQLCNILYI